jgi:hypothetical protein
MIDGNDEEDHSVEDEDDFDEDDLHDEEDFNEPEDLHEEEDDIQEAPIMKEDIYGRTIDTKGNVVKNASSKEN